MKSLGRSSRNNPKDWSLLPPQFYLRDTARVARELLGKGLYLRRGGETFLAEIVETEAYLGTSDPASHAYRGIRPRNRAMFELGGTCYVYLSYGINYCMNVSTGPKGVGEAVLLRAAAPLEGLATMHQNRKTDKVTNLLSGPGKLTQALGIDLSFNGLRFDRADLQLLDLGRQIPNKAIGQSPRIGISVAKDERLRFFIKDSIWLSRKG